MGGQASTKVEKDDPCWIVVDSVNSPTGRWRGVVELVEPTGLSTGTFLVSARIVDDRVEKGFQNRQPSMNYQVYPITRDFTHLLDQIDTLKGDLRQTKHNARVQVEALTDVIIALKKHDFDDPKKQEAMPNKYNMVLSEKQAEIIVRALDIYSRVGIGQFEEVLQVYDPSLKLTYDQRENIRVGLNAAKTAAGHPVNGSYGIHHPEVREEFRGAFDVMQAVRHQLALDKSHSFRGSSVANDTPHKIGKENLPEITPKDGG